MKAKELMGRKVYDKDAIEIGKVSDLEIDVSSFTIQKIYIKSGMMSGHHVTPQDVDRIGDSLILKIAKGELKT
ncbi:MAG: PRC-barrel domain-containing protein [Theionarchaea archaeon]|nr:PRC-barrel domain-containing protein [Theionarchaea archaeon]MBU6999171.1 PRC-barrel domain-containing protein [Theionarchaea archaeon]MBU7019530.1 PRC-barrel domain-containing protein [Theionarchaea archaeon]